MNSLLTKVSSFPATFEHLKRKFKKTPGSLPPLHEEGDPDIKELNKPEFQMRSWLLFPVSFLS